MGKDTIFLVWEGRRRRQQEEENILWQITEMVMCCYGRAILHLPAEDLTQC